MPLPMYGVFCFTTFSSVHNYKFYIWQVHFHAQSIKASPVTIACKTAKLFVFSLINIDIHSYYIFTWTYSTYLLELVEYALE